jgi:paired amphipathic helix protein Sin3a
MSQPPSTTQRRLNVSDALGFLDAVKAKFRDAPQFYDRFLNTMSDFKAGR